MKNELVYLYSHPRSGSNFILATLYKNFYAGMNLSGNAGVIGHWKHRTNSTGLYHTRKKRVDRNMHSKIFGGHRFRPVKVRNNPIYVIRDGRDVVLSLWRTKWMLSPDDQDISFEYFLRKKIDWLGNPGGKLRGKPRMNPVQHWKAHVNNWYGKKGRDGICYVRFENMVTNPVKTLKGIKDYFGLKRVSEKLDKIDYLVGWSPNKGVIGSWKEVFSENDIEFFHKFVPRDYKWIW